MIVIAASRNYTIAKYAAIAGSLLSLMLFPLASSGTESFTWFSIAGVPITLTASLLPLNSLLLLIVLSIGVLIMIYSAGYMDLPSEQRRYYIEMLAFETAMLTFAMAGDFIVLFIAWEFLSLTSYLLIGFWYNRESAIAAARKAVTIILIGDIALLASIVVFQNEFGSLQFGTILSGIGSGVGILPVALLLIAVMAKSAQFPLQEWLADAMEGPTPVSAYLHSSTMVKAGIFVTFALFPLFSAAGLLTPMLAIGSVTVALGIFGATRERQVKRVLAYSTIQELGLMLVAVASNALLAAVYFFFAQSFYKALLFFSSGVSMKATDREDLEDISGIRHNKLIYITTLFGVLALAGFIPFDGFFANIGIGSAFSSNLIAYVLISLVSLTTSFYIFRWLFMQSKRSTSPRVTLNYSAMPKSMVYSLVVLAAATLGASWFFFSFPNLFPGLGGGTANIGIYEAAIEMGLVIAGAVIGFVIYAQKRKSKLRKIGPEVLFNTVYTAVFMNALYWHIAEFIAALGEGIAYIDSGLNNAFDLLGHSAMGISEGTRRLSSGSINTYVALFAIGVLVLVVVVVIV